MIGKIMLCSSAMVLQVSSFYLRTSPPVTQGFPQGNRVERCLSYDEKPLLLFQRLKDASKNPVFMLKHIKDIRSPIAIAEQKKAARNASGKFSSFKFKRALHVWSPSRPPGIRVHPDASANVVPAPMTGTSAQPGWPEVMSPTVDNKDREDTTDRERLKGASDSEPPKSAGLDTASASSPSHDEIGTPVREVPVTAEISYAVAIYPYMSEQEDEFDVVVYVSSIMPFHEPNHE
jgi:protein STE50